MADNWNDQELGIQNGQFSPVVEGGFVHVDGETHILNYDTNVLSLDQDRQPTEVATAPDEDQPQSSYYDSDEEEEGIEVSCPVMKLTYCRKCLTCGEQIFYREWKYLLLAIDQLVQYVIRFLIN